MHCAAHPSVETAIACSKCGTPICPKCLVQTPVGMRCRDCAYAGPRPWEVKPHMLAKSMLLGFGVAVIGGLVWGVVGDFLSLLSWIAAGLVGHFVAEAVAWGAAGRKSGMLITVAVAYTLLAFLISLVMGNIAFLFNPFGLIIALLGLVIALSAAVYRLR